MGSLRSDSSSFQYIVFSSVHKSCKSSLHWSRQEQKLRLSQTESERSHLSDHQSGLVKRGDCRDEANMSARKDSASDKAVC